MQKNIPSSVDMAREAIKKYPKLFLQGVETEIVLSRLMRDYREKCTEYLAQDQPIINDILQSLNNLQS